MKKFQKILNNYNVYGYENISKAILAALVAREPILLTGEHGTGKTLLAEKLSVALGVPKKQFIAYDASKALFEDVIGFPNPASLKNGEVKYINTPITIWNKKFILIDEISRANPSMQNKWFEVIRSRRIMGHEISTLEFIFAAMNPLGYLGVNPLDEALADRFFLIVNVPSEFLRNDLLKIINSPDNKATENKSNDLIELIENIRTEVKNVNPKHQLIIDNYVMDFTEKIQKLGLSFSPRRAAMLKRAITIFFSIDIIENSLSHNSISKNLLEATIFSWNYTVTNEEPHYDKLKEAFLFATKKTSTHGKETLKNFAKYKGHNETRKQATKTNTHASNPVSSSNNYDDESDLVSMFKILGAGVELFTVGFYEMILKGNSNWKSKLDINN